MKTKHRVVDVANEAFEHFLKNSNADLELVDIQYVKEGPNRFLRIFIENDDSGISFEDCKSVSSSVSEYLDNCSTINDKYILEVSSPGLERPLKKPKDFKKFEGKLAEFKFYAPIPELNLKKVTGYISNVDDNGLSIILNDTKKSDEIINVNFDQIAASKLKFEF